MTDIGIQPFAKIPDRSRPASFTLRAMAAKLSASLKTSLKLGAPEEGDRPRDAPTVNAVICAYNEERNIGSLLTAILTEELDEIIVVASGCTDRTVDIVRSFGASDSRVRLLMEDKRNGKASAVNLALKMATSEYIVFLAADVRPLQGSIRRLIQGFTPEIGIRAGRPIPIDEESSVMGKLSRLIWTIHNRTLHELSSEGRLGHTSGEFFAIRRGLIRELPPGVVNDDAFMAIAVRQAGFKIDFEDAAEAFMRGPGTITDYVAQRRRVHFGHIQVMKATGAYPTVFESQALARPMLFLHMLRDEMRGLGGGLRALLLGGTLEVIALILSNFDRLVGRTHVLWRMVDSTKSLTRPFGGVVGFGSPHFSIPGAYLELSLDRIPQFGSIRDRLSRRSEVLAPRSYMCY